MRFKTLVRMKEHPIPILKNPTEICLHVETQYLRLQKARMEMKNRSPETARQTCGV